MDKELRQTLIQWVGAREARWVLHYRYPTAELTTHHARVRLTGLRVPWAQGVA
jgi:hypothetical protein